MIFESLRYEVSGGVALITLDREHRHNAIDAAMDRELPQAWTAFNTDPNAVVAIVTGAGNRSFCSGADIGDIPALDLSSSAAASDSMKWTSRHNDVWKPVICAVNGLVNGAGLHFLADSDIVVAADTATFFDSHVNVGLVSALESVALARRMPLEAVLRMALLGSRERMSASRAQQCGLVGEVVPADQLLDRAFAIARLMLENSPAAMARTKRAIWAAKQGSLDEALQYAWELVIENNSGADYEEGLRAFTEKRPPCWQPYPPDVR
ncbi:MAG: enoyl-CoA hydratase/isomerase family protein [Halieaceae bacterium]|uniref:enoyl-CoA hydratase/isomerase family protein n=1 Tax=Haliea alexandrii TaxID=2448162 RepID=UPI000F0BAD8D|nr:enoyl-CoA hydratase/isomerase family protein [Haliea alexandrii]MCR9184186.1 enoyl-CoA hydratase/isomerase family protein [Halieaceae bacterium]